MMSRFDIRTEWLNPPEPEEAFGPERSTWARLLIKLDGFYVTAQTQVEGGGETEAVVGGLSGIADWLVDNWLFILWETHTPFPKVGVDSTRRIPTLGEERREDFLLDVEPASLATWQHRHTLGHGSSDLAMPAIVFLPEERHVGIAVRQPSYELDPTVRFTGPWPSEPVWISKDDFASTLKSVILSTIQRAREDDSTKAWAEWLERRFALTSERAGQESTRRRIMLGDVVADQWDV